MIHIPWKLYIFLDPTTYVTKKYGLILNASAHKFVYYKLSDDLEEFINYNLTDDYKKGMHKQ